MIRSVLAGTGALVVAAVAVLGAPPSAARAADRFRPDAAVPVVTGVTPVAADQGGTVITLHGHHLRTATGVLFGTTPGTAFHAVDDSTATVVAPALPAGSSVLPRVESPAGPSHVGVGADVAFVAASAVPRWSNPIRPGNGVARLVQASCGPDLACGFMDSAGAVHVLRPGALATLPPAPGSNGRAQPLGCTTGLCITPHGYYRNGTWTALSSPLRQTVAIACASSAWCLAVGADSDYTVFDGSSWSAAAPVGGTVLTGPSGPEGTANIVSCPSVGHCFLAGFATVWEFRASAWTGLPEVPGAGDDPFLQITCPTDTFCTVPGWGVVNVLTAGRWSQLDAPTIAVGACPAANDCVAPGYHTLQHWDGASWRPAPPPGSANSRIITLSGSHYLIVTNGNLVSHT